MGLLLKQTLHVHVDIIISLLYNGQWINCPIKLVKLVSNRQLNVSALRLFVVRSIVAPNCRITITIIIVVFVVIIRYNL